MINDRLNRSENEVMNAVFELSSGKERFLASLSELRAVLPAKKKYDEISLTRLLRSLSLDGYFELFESERKGEKVFVFHMREFGLSFRRQDVQRKRSLLFRILLAALGAVVTFLVGLLLRAIFP